MTSASSSASVSRRARLGVAPRPVFRAAKRSSGSGARKPVCCESNHLVEARAEVPGTDAFEEMFVASRKQFVAMAYSVLRNTEDAEDAVQNAFISGYLHLRMFQGRSALKTWFTRVVLNAALMIRRKRKLDEFVSLPERSAEEGGQWMDAIPLPKVDTEIATTPRASRAVKAFP